MRKIFWKFYYWPNDVSIPGSATFNWFGSVDHFTPWDKSGTFDLVMLGIYWKTY